MAPRAHRLTLDVRASHDYSASAMNPRNNTYDMFAEMQLLAEGTHFIPTVSADH